MMDTYLSLMALFKGIGGLVCSFKSRGGRLFCVTVCHKTHLYSIWSYDLLNGFSLVEGQLSKIDTKYIKMTLEEGSFC